jgi:uncharacterized DUF497 family protein
MLENYDCESVIGFDWNERKSELNLAKHGIDFGDAIEVAVVFTRRENVIRIVSARRARKNEERDYRNAEMGRPPEGQD